VLVDVPKDIQQQLALPDWEAPMAITGYMSRLPPHPEASQLAAVAKAIKGAKKPVSCMSPKTLLRMILKGLVGDGSI
jgi:acetolactate synthase-1/2/3 large subunit